MARIVWTREALANLELIRSYIQQFDPQAAQRMAQRLIEAGDSLRTFPDRGRLASGGKRELVTIPSYIIRNKVDGDRVFIVSIRHSAQLPNKHGPRSPGTFTVRRNIALHSSSGDVQIRLAFEEEIA